MTEKIIEAYRTVTNYCYNYSFSFKKEELETAPRQTRKDSGMKDSP